MPVFVPTAADRQLVLDNAGLRMTWEELALNIINPRTGKPISKNTLQEHFPDELAAGKARLKNKINTKYLEALDKGDAWAIQFGFRNIHGWKDGNPVGTNADGTENGGISSIQVSFVMPKKASTEEA